MEKRDVLVGPLPVEPSVVEDFMLLMSLALDGLLDDAEDQRFQRHLAQYPEFAVQWQTWQALDGDLHAAPAALPPVDFVANVELRIQQAERRRRLWLGVGVGIGTVLLWGTVLITVASAGAFVVLNQSGWLGDLIRVLAYSSAAISSWFASLLRSVDVVLGAPQVRSFGLTYVLVAVSILAGWFHLLRRSTRVLEPVPAV